MGQPTIEVPDLPEDWNDPVPTKPDPEFVDKVADFIQGAADQGISLQFTQGYRDQAAQDALHNDPMAITPADNSLHSAGRAVDIHWRTMDPATQNRTVEAAKAAGLSWGGDYSKPDPVHFYSGPGTDRLQLIDKFSQGIATLNGQIPDR